jgi:predicted transcriptional regulator of viral defense system
VSRAVLWNHVQAGMLVRHRRGVYQLRDMGGLPLGPFFAVQLAGTAGTALAVVSHESALWVHGLLGRRPHAIHVSVPRDKREGCFDAGVVRHPTQYLPAEELAMVRGLQVTTVERSLIDCLEARSLRQVGRVMRLAVASNHATEDCLLHLAQLRPRWVQRSLRRVLARGSQPTSLRGRAGAAFASNETARASGHAKIGLHLASTGHGRSRWANGAHSELEKTR